jgi:hypothetical protein
MKEESQNLNENTQFCKGSTCVGLGHLLGQDVAVLRALLQRQWLLLLLLLRLLRLRLLLELASCLLQCLD